MSLPTPEGPTTRTSCPGRSEWKASGSETIEGGHSPSIIELRGLL
ncbi:MAG: hypothetical protein ACJZ9G_06855 [Rhodospirillales bacterium]